MDNQLKTGKKISLRLDTFLADRLQDCADRERVPVSYLLRHLVLRFVNEPASGEKQALPARRGVSAETLLTRAEKLQAEFSSDVCSTFDALRRQGYDRKEAAKRTNYALKAKNHPWATYEIIEGVLRQAGRMREKKGVMR
jgi:hypothetical protein